MVKVKAFYFCVHNLEVEVDARDGCAAKVPGRFEVIERVNDKGWYSQSRCSHCGPLPRCRMRGSVIFHFYSYCACAFSCFPVPTLSPVVSRLMFCLRAVGLATVRKVVHESDGSTSRSSDGVTDD